MGEGMIHCIPGGTRGRSRILVWLRAWGPGWVWGKAPEAQTMLRHEAVKNHLWREKQVHIYILTLYDNVIIIIISSTRCFMFPAVLS